MCFADGLYVSARPEAVDDGRRLWDTCRTPVERLLALESTAKAMCGFAVPARGSALRLPRCARFGCSYTRIGGRARGRGERHGNGGQSRPVQCVRREMEAARMNPMSAFFELGPGRSDVLDEACGYAADD